MPLARVPPGVVGADGSAAATDGSGGTTGGNAEWYINLDSSSRLSISARVSRARALVGSSGMALCFCKAHDSAREGQGGKGWGQGAGYRGHSDGALDEHAVHGSSGASMAATLPPKGEWGLVHDQGSVGG